MKPVALSLLVTALCACQSTGATPITGRARPSLSHSNEDLAQLGASAYEAMVGKYKVLLTTPEARMVAKVAYDLTKASGQRINWDVRLLDDPSQANAFALPGGKIAVFTGLLPIAQGEDGIASALSHEIAHIVLEHARERSTEHKSQLGWPAEIQSKTWSELTEDQKIICLSVFGLGYVSGKVIPYSDIHEREADEIGLQFMAKAGYKQSEAPAFWHRMEALSQSEVSQKNSAHPLPETRAKALEARVNPKK